MAEYLAPGVYVEEISAGPKPIAGVSTSTAGFVGPCHQGPTEPTLVRSFADFRFHYGEATDLDGGSAGPQPNYLADAVRGFFDNGGRRAYIARERCDLAAALAALAKIEEVSIIAAPGVSAISGDAERHAAHSALIRHAEQHRRFAILSAPLTTDLTQVRAYRAQFDSPFAAMYFPWVLVTPPNIGPARAVPADGHIAGIFARTDRRHGVHKAPANEHIQGIRGLSFLVTQTQQAALNPEGINCLRVIPGRGRLVYGARTLSSDPEWRYIPVRRQMTFLEHSIERGTQWAVFEPNAEPLWANVRASIENFLHRQWLSGALQGTKAEQAYFVRCDRTTMTQGDIDSGRLIAQIGVAPLRPAEFVIFRIGQWTADRRG